MVLSKATGSAHRDDGGEARILDQLGGRVEGVATKLQPLSQQPARPTDWTVATIARGAVVPELTHMPKLIGRPARQTCYRMRQAVQP